jgi:hypothetical protein
MKASSVLSIGFSSKIMLQIEVLSAFYHGQCIELEDDCITPKAPN